MPVSEHAIPRQRKLVYAAVVVALVAGAVELGARALYAQRSRAARYLAQDYYQKRDWSRALLETEHALGLRYEPYVGWRSRDVRSLHVNVIDGERLTVHAEKPTEQAVRIWCCGGSTMWGRGVRDAYTIPSHLARLAHGSGLDVRVRNLGDTGWVSTQEALYVSLLCRAGERPDLVVYYDGVNDVFAAYQSGRADGAHQNLDVFEDYFEKGYDARRGWRQRVAAVRLIQGVLRRVLPGEASGGLGESQFDETAAAVGDSYRRTVDYARGVGDWYGFETVFFWQPIIAHVPEFRRAERQAYEHMSTPDLEGMLAFYQQATPHAIGDPVVDLTGCLGSSPPEGYFIDHNHLNEAGNAVVARAIWARIEPAVARLSSRGSVGGVQAGGVQASGGDDR